MRELAEHAAGWFAIAMWALAGAVFVALALHPATRAELASDPSNALRMLAMLITAGAVIQRCRAERPTPPATAA